MGVFYPPELPDFRQAYRCQTVRTRVTRWVVYAFLSYTSSFMAVNVSLNCEDTWSFISVVCQPVTYGFRKSFGCLQSAWLMGTQAGW